MFVFANSFSPSVASSTRGFVLSFSFCKFGYNGLPMCSADIDKKLH